MKDALISTKLFIPFRSPKAVPRIRLMNRLNEGLHRKLTLISASAGFGKTTVVSEWLAQCERPAAWLSLDKEDNDPKRFITYLIAALQTIQEKTGEQLVKLLQMPQSPSIEFILPSLLHEIEAIECSFILVLDDYHLIADRSVTNVLLFLLTHLPSTMHLVVITREDPQFPLARLRAYDQLTELRGADLCFNENESVQYFDDVMSLDLSLEEVALLKSRTEGWIAGLQLAAISLRETEDKSHLIDSFSGTHHFIFDYLADEVWRHLPVSMQTFLLRTSILERFCASLCDAVLGEQALSPDGQGSEEMLQQLVRLNLFIFPLDQENHWFRYHHLFADTLRKKFAAVEGAEAERAVLHSRASLWFEQHGLEIEAFSHAAAASDIERAGWLMEGGGMPLHFRGAVRPVLNWLESLPAAVLAERPAFIVAHASALLFISKLTGIEQKLQMAEAALLDAEQNGDNQNVRGHIAVIRATVAVSLHQPETIILQSERALRYLLPDNVPVRTAATWTLGYAYQLQGKRLAAGRAYTEAISASKAIGHSMITLMATIGLGNVQESEMLLESAARTYQNALHLAGHPPLPVACEAYLGLARIFYEWNDLNTSLQHVKQGAHLAGQLGSSDRAAACELFLIRLRLTEGDTAGALARLAELEQIARQKQYDKLQPDIADLRGRILLQRGELQAALQLASSIDCALLQARVYLAAGDVPMALKTLTGWDRYVEEKEWLDEQLKVEILQSLIHHARDEQKQALQKLKNALQIAEPHGFIRLFLDEGGPMVNLLAEAATRGLLTSYGHRLLLLGRAERRAFKDVGAKAVPLLAPLTARELEVLRLIAKGLSNREICDRLFLALSTVKGYNRTIFDKLHVHRRTEAVARARDLGLI
ncbi:LuxR C-terminal-related transcriptional regulator [Alkalihalobacillus oceani]|nr:LuxR C-terminal-related transcriptional regulator [Halalkalibacter oceani]MCM3762778.1 LuxR C-terminal-related transcriptional regulator [Halalkalibacter oceani]